MIKECKNCHHRFESKNILGLAGQTEKEVAEFKERRPTSDLCDECLIDEISAKSQNLSAPQD